MSIVSLHNNGLCHIFDYYHVLKVQLELNIRFILDLFVIISTFMIENVL